jgi:hypothetical protein
MNKPAGVPENLKIRRVLKYMVLVFIWSILLNYPWEMLQMPFYMAMSFSDPVSWLLCFRASFGDGVIILGIWAFGYLIFRKYDWVRKVSPAALLVCLVSGAVIAVVIELAAVKTGRWRYSDIMPVLPGLEVGLIPFLQLILLPWPSIRLALRGRL